MGCDPTDQFGKQFPSSNLFQPPANPTLFDAWLPANEGLTTKIIVETDHSFIWQVPCNIVKEDTIAVTSDSKPPIRCGHFPSHTNIGTPILTSPATDDPYITRLTWQRQAGATRYILYASPNPMFRNKVKEVPATQNTTTFNTPIILPEDIVFYFWVSYLNPAGKEIFIQAEPVYLYNNSVFDPNHSAISPDIQETIAKDDDMSYYFEEIRRRNQFELENDGEEYFLYIRRMHGQPCVELNEDGTRVTPMSTPFYTDLGKDFNPAETAQDEQMESDDPEYQHTARCENCFGTGIAGGYYPRLKIKIRYGDLPRRVIDMKEQGLSFRHDFDSWTLAHPRLKERDMLIRITDGERFTVKAVGQSEWRTPALHQEFSTVSLPRSAIEYMVNDNKIVKALEREGAWDVGKWDWSAWQ